VLLHVLGHVEVDERVLVAEHELGQGLGEQRLADARGADEDERAHRTLGVLEAARGCGGWPWRSALMASSWLMTFLCSSSSSLSRRSASSFSRRVSGTPVILLTTSAMTSSSTTPSTPGAVAPLALDVFLLLAHLLGLVAQLGGALVVRGLDRLVLLDAQALDLGLDLGRFGGLVMLLMRTRAPASSITSIALSGWTRPVM
jgi:hypothetical protein